MLLRKHNKNIFIYVTARTQNPSNQAPFQSQNSVSFYLFIYMYFYIIFFMDIKFILIPNFVLFQN